MKITAFHAADGDCFLLTSSGASPRRILVDGGRQKSYEANTRDFLGRLREDGGKIDLLCVSHIDDDHITGILRLVEDEVEWRAFEFLNDDNARPKFRRPPEIAQVWHNGLILLVGDENAHHTEHVLGTIATVLAGSPLEGIQAVASALDDLVTGERASMELNRRLAPEQLDIPLNPKADGKLLTRRASGAPSAAEVVRLGNLDIFLLGPSQDDIDKLRIVWQKFIDEGKGRLAELHAEMIADEKSLGTLSPRIVANPMLDQALGQGLSGVTEANLASLMLLVEENGATALLTGDGVSSEILEGLKRHRKLDANGSIHVNLLKVQHHGARANVTTDFVKRVTADNYLFCGNGAHHNPEIEVVEAFANARLTGIDGGPAVGPATPFKFWFTSGPTTPDDSKTKSRKAHMTKVKDRVAQLRQGHTQRMLAPAFLKDGHFEIDL
jgi:beta-lactamase superfamily II metal-dependent hydrolase